MLGELKLIPVEGSYHFWTIFDELSDDKSDFIHNRAIILSAYGAGELYSLQEVETDENYRADRPAVLCKGGGMRLLPCFCIVDEDMQCDIIWVHSRARGIGLGKKLVELANIKSIRLALPESIGFWEKCGITKDKNGHSAIEKK